MLDDSLADALQVIRYLFVGDDLVVSLHMLGNSVSQIHFLLVRENVSAGSRQRKRRRLAVLLCGDWWR
jgi:5'-3' exonuclease